MKIADIEQIHSFWVIIWNYLTRFKFILNLEETQNAITSVNQSKSHPFWGKLKEAVWTLVKIPKEKSSFRFHSQGDTLPISTKEWLTQTVIEIPPALKRDFALEQPASFGGTNHVRAIYDADNLFVLGNIVRLFGNLTDTPFDSRVYVSSGIGGTYPHTLYTLPRIEQLVVDARENGSRIISEPDAEHIFAVRGRKGPLMISVRKKLDTWRMRRIEAGDGFRGPNAYVFI